MIARGRGSIVNVSSRLAYSAPLGSSQLPKRAVYVGANAYVSAFSQLVQSELERTGVMVQALCPGVVETEFHERVGIDPGRYPASIVMKPEDVVQASLRGLELGEAICVPALEDLSLLEQVQESQKRLFELTRSGTLAERYRPRIGRSSIARISKMPLKRGGISSAYSSSQQTAPPTGGAVLCEVAAGRLEGALQASERCSSGRWLHQHSGAGSPAARRWQSRHGRHLRNGHALIDPRRGQRSYPCKIPRKQSRRIED